MKNIITKKDVSWILIIIIPFIWLNMINMFIDFGKGEFIKTSTVKEKEKYIPTTVKEKIEVYATEYGVDVEEALLIAKCESGFNASARSKISTAKGVFQFIDSTWHNYCEGDVLNEDDNIKCFMSNYKEHKSWWECKI